jgi:hypothetical protein
MGNKLLFMNKEYGQLRNKERARKRRGGNKEEES